jgi:hypothetical protein
MVLIPGRTAPPAMSALLTTVAAAGYSAANANAL